MSDKLEARLLAFTDHAPSPAVQDKMTALRKMFMVDVALLDESIPECREKSLAFTALEESAMWAMKALSLTDPGKHVVSL